MRRQTYTTNVHMITWLPVSVKKTGVKTRFKAELIEGKCLNIDYEERLADDR